MDTILFNTRSFLSFIRVLSACLYVHCFIVCGRVVVILYVLCAFTVAVLVVVSV